MPFTDEQQAIELIKRSQRILIATKQFAAIDALASLSALFTYLTEQGKNVDIVAPDIKQSDIPWFIPNANKIQSKIGAIRTFKLRLDVSKVPMSELMYDVKDGSLNITVVPKIGEWSPKDISFRHGNDRYDLVIALDCPDMQSLGSLFLEHADFFYRTTIITIGRDPAHEYWGQINLVNLTAVSTTEVLLEIFNRWNSNKITDDVATALLTGMIFKTQSFRTPNVTPNTLALASKLISLGARREEIVHGLWRTRSVPTLKLWGRALSRLEQDTASGLTWTILSRQDFLDAGANSDALEGVVNELVAYTQNTKIILIIHETEDSDKSGIKVSIYAMPPYSAANLARPFGGTGTRDYANFHLAPGTPIIEGTKILTDKLKANIKDLQK